MSRVTKGDNGITKGYSTKHKGVDIGWHKLESDNNILAHSDGTVTWVQKGQSNNKGATGNKSYGNAIKIKHNNGMYTLYAHLRTVKVSKGKTVKKGAIIGVMGNTGNSYGRHLHFEVRDKADKRINPTPYINNDLPNNPTGKKYILLFDKWLRKEPKVAINKIRKVAKNTVILSVDDKLYKSTTGSKWIKTTLSGVTGYICIYDSTGVQVKEV